MVSVPDKVTYEQPLNERVRIFLRLEHLFRQVSHHMHGETVWDTRAVVTQLIDVLNIFSRSDLKSEVLKELDRHGTTLARMRQNPEVDHQRLGEVLTQIGTLSDRLYTQPGQTGAKLRNNEFLKSIMQRSSIPGGSCAFDLPAYQCWLERPIAERKRTLHEWLSSFDVVEQAVRLILHLIRSSGAPSQERAEGGFFQQTLDTNLPYQLIRVSVPASYGAFAEISGGKHRFAVRFKTADEEGGSSQLEQDVEFELIRCIM
jgi:cell division protein ZapD